MTTVYGGSEDRGGVASEHGTFKFPAFNPDLSPYDEREEDELHDSGHQPRDESPPPPSGHRRQRSSTTVTAHTGSNWQWTPRREVTLGARWLGGGSHAHSHGGPSHTGRHGRQKSLSEAIQTIRTRRASMSQNAHEIADALKAPVSPTLIVCPPFPLTQADQIARYWIADSETE
jgi:solute carrier family 35, member E1